MTSTYTPDTWNVVRVSGPGDDPQLPVEKVIGGWRGGYLDGDSWRVNSGIVQARDLGDVYEFVGYSGSVYVCRKTCEGLLGYAAGVLTQLKENAVHRGHTITVIPAADFVAAYTREESDSLR